MLSPLPQIRNARLCPYPQAAFRVQAADDEAVCAVRVVKDRTFAAVGTQVHGFSKKGKGFYDISTFMAEPIRFMFVHPSPTNFPQSLCSHQPPL